MIVLRGYTALTLESPSDHGREPNPGVRVGRAEPSMLTKLTNLNRYKE